MGMGPAWEMGLIYPVSPHWKKLISPFPAVPMANNFPGRGGTLSLLPFLGAGISSSSNCAVLGVCCHRLCEFICASALLCLEDAVSSSHLPPLFLQPFYLLVHISLSFEGRALKASHSGLSASKSLTLCTLSDNPHLLQEAASLMRAEQSANAWGEQCFFSSDTFSTLVTAWSRAAGTGKAI